MGECAAGCGAPAMEEEGLGIEGGGPSDCAGSEKAGG